MKKIVREMKKLGFEYVGASGGSHLTFEKQGVRVFMPSSPTNLDISLKNARSEWMKRMANLPVKGQVQ